MATVPNLGATLEPVDRKLATPNRTVTVVPLSTTTPIYAGEIVLDTVTNGLWVAQSLQNDSWIPITKVT
jgi:hypothetical protein